MAWNDNEMMKTFLRLKDEFRINTFVETGTFKGINAELYAHYFLDVFTVEINNDFFEISKERLKRFKNVHIFHMSSWKFLTEFKNDYEKMKRTDTVFFYFDAHFYDPSLPYEDKWVVIKELRALEHFKNAIICIHDFECVDLGYLNYADEHLNFDLIKSYLNKINENFVYYTNSRDFCDINDEKSIKNLSITIDEHVLDAVKFINSSDWKKYRGVLYAVPHALDLNTIKLKQLDSSGDA